MLEQVNTENLNIPKKKGSGVSGNLGTLLPLVAANPGLEHLRWLEQSLIHPLTCLQTALGSQLPSGFFIHFCLLEASKKLWGGTWSMTCESHLTKATHTAGIAVAK